MGRRDARIFSTLPEAVAATNPQTRLQAPSSKIPGQGTSRDFALCIGRSMSILVCRLRCISAKFRPLPLNPCTRRGLHRFCAPSITLNVFRGSDYEYSGKVRWQTSHRGTLFQGCSVQNNRPSLPTATASALHLSTCYEQIRLAVTCFQRASRLRREKLFRMLWALRQITAMRDSL